MSNPSDEFEDDQFDFEDEEDLEDFEDEEGQEDFGESKASKKDPFDFSAAQKPAAEAAPPPAPAATRPSAPRAPAPNPAAQPPARPAPPPAKFEHQTAALASDVGVSVSAVMGKKSLTVQELLSLKKGQVVELNRYPNEAIDLVANGKLMAKGELVEIEGKLGVRIIKIF